MLGELLPQICSKKKIIKVYKNSNHSREELKLNIKKFLSKFELTKCLVIQNFNQTFIFLQIMIAANYSSLLHLNCNTIRIEYL